MFCKGVRYTKGVGEMTRHGYSLQALTLAAAVMVAPIVVAALLMLTPKAA
jgi:hypothetical protein